MVKNLFETTWQKIWQIFFVAYASHTAFGVSPLLCPSILSKLLNNMQYTTTETYTSTYAYPIFSHELIKFKPYA